MTSLLETPPSAFTSLLTTRSSTRNVSPRAFLFLDEFIKFIGESRKNRTFRWPLPVSCPSIRTLNSVRGSFVNYSKVRRIGGWITRRIALSIPRNRQWRRGGIGCRAEEANRGIFARPQVNCAQRPLCFASRRLELISCSIALESGSSALTFQLRRVLGTRSVEDVAIVRGSVAILGRSTRHSSPSSRLTFRNYLNWGTTVDPVSLHRENLMFDRDKLRRY